MSSNATIQTVSGVAGLLTSHGAALPEPVTKARDTWNDLRKAPPPPPNPKEIGAIALDESPERAAEALVAAESAVRVHKEAIAVAATRAHAALQAHGTEIVDLILTSPRIKDAASTIAEVAPTANPSVRRFPDGPGADVDDVIAAATLRKAEATITATLTALDTYPLGTYFGVDDASSPYAALVWIDPTGVTDERARLRLLAALRGYRAGVSPMQATVLGQGGLPEKDQTPLGITSASAASVPGVAFHLVTSLDEWDERVRHAGTTIPTQDDPAVGGSTAVTVL